MKYGSSQGTCREIVSAAQRSDERAQAELTRANVSLASARQARRPARRFECLFHSSTALQSAGLAQIASGLARRDSLQLVRGLVLWSRARLLHGSVGVIGENPVALLYAVEIARMLEPERRVREAVGSVRSHWLSVADADCADVLAFLPPSQYVVDCRVAARPDVVALRFALMDRDPVTVGRIAQRLASHYSKEARWVGALPISWVPLPLILARAMCRRKGVRWREPEAPLWEMWRPFAPRRFRVSTPAVDNLFEEVRRMRSYVDGLRDRLREQIVLNQVFIGAGQDPTDVGAPRRRPGTGW